MLSGCSDRPVHICAKPVSYNTRQVFYTLNGLTGDTLECEGGQAERRTGRRVLEMLVSLLKLCLAGLKKGKPSSLGKTEKFIGISSLNQSFDLKILLFMDNLNLSHDQKCLHLFSDSEAYA